MNISDWIGRRKLILGDVNSGKSTLTAEVLHIICAQSMGSRVAVLDLAPEIPPDLASRKGLNGIGGGLLPAEGADVLYLTSPLKPPRLSSDTEEAALAIAADNASKIEELFRKWNFSERDILFINDLSMYAQAGNTAVLKGLLDSASTVVANGYYGTSLGRGVLSRRERRKMEKWKGFFHEILFLRIKGK